MNNFAEPAAHSAKDRGRQHKRAGPGGAAPLHEGPPRGTNCTPPPPPPPIRELVRIKHLRVELYANTRLTFAALHRQKEQIQPDLLLILRR